MPLGSSQLKTLQHAMDHELAYRQELLPSNVTITPHEKITACDNRENCIGCTNLMQGTEAGVHHVLYLPHEKTPSFALCDRGPGNSDKVLVTLKYNLASRSPGEPDVLDRVSTPCLREYGVHDSV